MPDVPVPVFLKILTTSPTHVIELLTISFSANSATVLACAGEGISGSSVLVLNRVCNPPVQSSCNDDPQQRVVNKQFGGIISFSRLIPRRVSIYALGLK